MTKQHYYTLPTYLPSHWNLCVAVLVLQSARKMNVVRVGVDVTPPQVKRTMTYDESFQCFVAHFPWLMPGISGLNGRDPKRWERVSLPRL